MTKDKLTVILDAAVSQSLLQQVSRTYRFSHDTIHEYLYRPTQGSIKAEKLHMSIGRQLWVQLKETSVDHNILLMTGKHMNKANHNLPVDKEELIAFAKPNLRAGKAAAARSA